MHVGLIGMYLYLRNERPLKGASGHGRHPRRWRRLLLLLLLLLLKVVVVLLLLSVMVHGQWRAAPTAPVR